MRNATAQLFEMMESNPVVKNYISNNWLCLFNDIYNHKDSWGELDEISAMAIVDIYEQEVV